MQFRCGNL